MADEHLENREATPLVMKYEDLQVEIGTMAKLTPGVLASAPKGYLVHSSFSSCVVSKRTTETRERKKIDRTGNMAFLFFSLLSRKENRSRERLERKNSEGENIVVGITVNVISSTRPNVYIYIYIGVGIENARESP